ncbi:HU family DNA-binding protein [Novilysobacter spongiicola]
MHHQNAAGITTGNRRAAPQGPPLRQGRSGGRRARRSSDSQSTAVPTAQESIRMNKADFVAAVADAAELSKSDAANAVDAVVSVITKTLKKGDTVTLVGFGTFQVRKRAARQGRNPKTGETIKIKASKNPAFKAGKALKDAVN